MEYKYPLTAINRTGKTIVLYTFEEVRVFKSKHGWWGEDWIKSWYWHGNRVSHPSVPWNWNRLSDPVYYDWIIRDDWGRKVKPTDFDFSNNARLEKHYKAIRHAEALGLPIPGQTHARAGWCANAPAKKNSGKGKRNRDRALCEYEFQEYGIKNKYGKVQPWEGY